ncbi:hypothetical protein G6045_21840 [Streptomyces sp. YC504]|uniref:Oxidoreductase n=1 Tax=Streptomyces mesophilus TaxID=1775132 RepID=A0A6G4XNK3_9ACTN|nr:hypothetical protein [Streptomyces mesophilus]NGO78284.1 hypothetical protein [Streptomyces mesophilus]
MTGAQGADDPRTALEQAVRRQVLDEGPPVLLTEERKAPDAMRRWGRDHVVRACVIREAMLERAALRDSSQGVLLRGLVVVGHLDLNCLTTQANVRILDCHLRDGLTLSNARLSSLDLSGCLIEDGDDSCLGADNLTLQFDLRLEGTHVMGHAAVATVSLHGAQISGCVFAAGLHVGSKNGPGIDATNLVVKGDVYLDSATISARHRDGAALTLRGAEIGGRLHLSRGTVDNPRGPAVDCDRTRVNTGLLMRELSASGSTSPTGTLSFTDATLGGKADLVRARIRNHSGPSLTASRLRVDGDLDLSHAQMTSGGERSALNLFSTKITGTLSLSHARLRNRSGCVLNGQRLVVDGDAHLNSATFSTRSITHAAVNLFSAKIGGYASLSSARIKNELGTALFAVQLKVGGDLRLNEEFTARGGGTDGAIRLHASTIEGALDLSTAHLRSGFGPALSARSMEVMADFRADNIHITAQDLSSDSSGHHPHPKVDLRGSRIRGRLEVSPETVRANRSPGRKLVALDDLEYGVLDARIDVKQWIVLLADETPAYRSQPYQHLASRYREQGDEFEARQVLIAQHRDQLKRTRDQSVLLRFWQQLAGITIGFGHQPWRAVFGLVGIFMAMSVLALWGGGLDGEGCRSVERIGRAVESSLPLIRMQQLEGCSPGSGAAGLFFVLASWVAQVGAWMFATLFIVGLTNAVRRRPS